MSDRLTEAIVDHVMTYGHASARKKLAEWLISYSGALMVRMLAVTIPGKGRVDVTLDPAFVAELAEEARIRVTRGVPADA